MMLKVDARGDTCPLPVVKAKKAISELKGAGEVEVLVDNEIAVQNLTKMAQQKGYQYSAEKLAEREYRVLFTVGEASETPTEEAPACAPDTKPVQPLRRAASSFAPKLVLVGVRVSTSFRVI